MDCVELYSYAREVRVCMGLAVAKKRLSSSSSSHLCEGGVCMGFVVVKKGLMSSATPIDVFIRGLFPPTCTKSFFKIKSNQAGFLQFYQICIACCCDCQDIALLCTRMDFQSRYSFKICDGSRNTKSLGHLPNCAPDVRILSLEESKSQGTIVCKSRRRWI